MSFIETEKEQIIKGTLGFAVLSALSKTDQYGIQLLTNLQNTPFATQAGTLYPLLNKLQRHGLISNTWVESTQGPPRKYYGLTPAGKKHLTALTRHWQLLTKILKEGLNG